MFEAPTALVLDFLAWLEHEPRGYEETMAAWRTSCPRLPIWEDAFAHRLVERRRDTQAGPIVALTESGRALLEAERPRAST